MATSATDPALTMPATFSSTPSTTSSSANPSQTGGSGNNNNSPAGSELYLFTFLTTLLLLLGVSCAIIVRSLILRRRFRRRVQEAIANGVLVPGLMTNSMSREVGEKPKMWNIWIGSPESGVGTSTAAKNEELAESHTPMAGALSNVLPVSATKLTALESSNRLGLTPSSHMPSHAGIYGTARSSRFLHRIWPRRSPPPTDNANPTPPDLEAQHESPEGSNSQPEASTSASASRMSTNPTNGTPAEPETPQNSVQVSLLIAMPSAARSQYDAYVSQIYPSKSPTSSLRIHSTSISESKLGTDSEGGIHTASAAANGSAVDEVKETESGSKSTDNTGITRLSESSSAKGKAPDHSHPHPHNDREGVWGHLEEGEIPYMEFGVLEVVLNDPKSTEAGEGAQQATGSTSGAAIVTAAAGPTSTTSPITGGTGPGSGSGSR